MQTRPPSVGTFETFKLTRVTNSAFKHNGHVHESTFYALFDSKMCHIYALKKGKLCTEKAKICKKAAFKNLILLLKLFAILKTFLPSEHHSELTLIVFYCFQEFYCKIYCITLFLDNF